MWLMAYACTYTNKYNCQSFFILSLTLYWVKPSADPRSYKHCAKERPHFVDTPFG